MSVTAIIQARCGSTRLPNKIFKEFVGKPSLLHQLQRIKACQTINDLIIATTTLSEDDQVETFCREHGYKCFRGSQNDVLERFYLACLKFSVTDVIVRLTADCPLLDPEIIDRTVRLFLDNQVDYVSNTIERTFPIGTDTEVFNFKGLERCHKETPPEWREHVTPYFYKSNGIFKTLNLKNSENLGHVRLTLDTPEDYNFISEVYRRLYRPEKPIFGLTEIMNELRRDPELVKMNEKVSHRFI